MGAFLLIGGTIVVVDGLFTLGAAKYVTHQGVALLELILGAIMIVGGQSMRRRNAGKKAEPAEKKMTIMGEANTNEKEMPVLCDGRARGGALLPVLPEADRGEYGSEDPERVCRGDCRGHGVGSASEGQPGRNGQNE